MADRKSLPLILFNTYQMYIGNNKNEYVIIEKDLNTFKNSPTSNLFFYCCIRINNI